jgi:hypothetical protein
MWQEYFHRLYLNPDASDKNILKACRMIATLFHFLAKHKPDSNYQFIRTKMASDSAHGSNPIKFFLQTKTCHSDPLCHLYTCHKNADILYTNYDNWRKSQYSG